MYLRRALSSADKLSSLFLFLGCPSVVELFKTSEFSTASLSMVFDSILSCINGSPNNIKSWFIEIRPEIYKKARKFFRKFHHTPKYGKPVSQNRTNTSELANEKTPRTQDKIEVTNFSTSFPGSFLRYEIGGWCGGLCGGEGRRCRVFSTLERYVW